MSNVDEVFAQNLIALSEYCQRRKSRDDAAREKVVDVLYAIFNLLLTVSPLLISTQHQSLTDLLVDTICHDAFPIQKLSIRILVRLESKSSNPKIFHAAVGVLLSRADKHVHKHVYENVCIYAVSVLVTECPALLGSHLPKVVELVVKIIKHGHNNETKMVAYDAIRRIYKCCPASSSMQFTSSVIKSLCRHSEKTYVGRNSVATTLGVVVSRAPQAAVQYFNVIVTLLLKMLQHRDDLQVGDDFSVTIESVYVDVVDTLAKVFAQVIELNKSVSLQVSWQQTFAGKKKYPSVGPGTQSAVMFLVSSVSNKTFCALALMRFARCRVLQSQAKKSNVIDDRLVEDVAMVIEAVSKLLPPAPTEVLTLADAHIKSSSPQSVAICSNESPFTLVSRLSRDDSTRQIWHGIYRAVVYSVRGVIKMLSWEYQKVLVDKFILKWLQMGFTGARDIPQREQFLTLMLEIVNACDTQIAWWPSADGNPIEDSFSPLVEAVLNILQEQKAQHHQLRIQCAYTLRYLSVNAPTRLVKIFSILLNWLGVTLANMEVSNDKASAIHLPQLYGYAFSLASVTCELKNTSTSVPNDLINKLFDVAKTICDCKDSKFVARKQICGFVLLEALMSLGGDWLGPRVKSLFQLWKKFVGKGDGTLASLLTNQFAICTKCEHEEDLPKVFRFVDDLNLLLSVLRSMRAFITESHNTLLKEFPNLQNLLGQLIPHLAFFLSTLPIDNIPKQFMAATVDNYRCTVFVNPVPIRFPDLVVLLRAELYSMLTFLSPQLYASRAIPLVNLLAVDIWQSSLKNGIREFVSSFLPAEDGYCEIAGGVQSTECWRYGLGVERNGTTNISSLPFVGSNSKFLPQEFILAPQKCTGGSQSLLIPWSTSCKNDQSLYRQSPSPQWVVKKNAIELHSTMMGQLALSERVAVIRHLLSATLDCQKNINDAEVITQSGQFELGMVVLVCLYEILRKGYPVYDLSSSNSEENEKKDFLEVEDLHRIRVMCTNGLSDECSTMRRLHAHILAILFTSHKDIADGMTEFVSNNVQNSNANTRAGISFFICATLRHACAKSNPSQVDVQNPSEHWARMLPLFPHLLELAKEVHQPVRTWVLHSLYTSIRSVQIMALPNVTRICKVLMAQRLEDSRDDVVARYQISLIVEAIGKILVDGGEQYMPRAMVVWHDIKNMNEVIAGSGLYCQSAVSAEVACIRFSCNVHTAFFSVQQIKDYLLSEHVVIRLATVEYLNEMIADGKHFSGGELKDLFCVLYNCLNRNDTNIQPFQDVFAKLSKQNCGSHPQVVLSMLLQEEIDSKSFAREDEGSLKIVAKTMIAGSRHGLLSNCIVPTMKDEIRVFSFSLLLSIMKSTKSESSNMPKYIPNFMHDDNKKEYVVGSRILVKTIRANMTQILTVVTNCCDRANESSAGSALAEQALCLLHELLLMSTHNKNVENAVIATVRKNLRGCLLPGVSQQAFIVACTALELNICPGATWLLNMLAKEILVAGPIKPHAYFCERTNTKLFLSKICSLCKLFTVSYNNKRQLVDFYEWLQKDVNIFSQHITGILLDVTTILEIGEGQKLYACTHSDKSALQPDYIQAVTSVLPTLAVLCQLKVWPPIQSKNTSSEGVILKEDSELTKHEKVELSKKNYDFGDEVSIIWKTLDLFTNLLLQNRIPARDILPACVAIFERLQFIKIGTESITQEIADRALNLLQCLSVCLLDDKDMVSAVHFVNLYHAIFLNGSNTWIGEVCSTAQDDMEGHIFSAVSTVFNSSGIDRKCLDVIASKLRNGSVSTRWLVHIFDTRFVQSGADWDRFCSRIPSKTLAAIVCHLCGRENINPGMLAIAITRLAQGLEEYVAEKSEDIKPQQKFNFAPKPRRNSNPNLYPRLASIISQEATGESPLKDKSVLHAEEDSNSQEIDFEDAEAVAAAFSIFQEVVLQSCESEAKLVWLFNLLENIQARSSPQELAVILPRICPALEKMFTENMSCTVVYKFLSVLLAFSGVGGLSENVKISLARIVFGILLLHVEKNNGDVSDISSSFAKCARSVDPSLFRTHILNTLSDNRKQLLQNALRAVLQPSVPIKPLAQVVSAAE